MQTSLIYYASIFIAIIHVYDSRLAFHRKRVTADNRRHTSGAMNGSLERRNGGKTSTRKTAGSSSSVKKESPLLFLAVVADEARKN